MRRLFLTISGLLVCLGLRPALGDDAASLSDVIDRHIQVRLDTDGLQRAAQADDGEFLRRVYLDLHGVVPSAEQAAKFLDRSDPDKRTQLIDELLASPRFGEHIADLWSGRLLSPQLNDRRKQEAFTNWLAGRFNSASWDRIATDLLTATGKLEENAAVIYLIEGNFPLGVTDLTDLSTRYFLGVRLNCAQCHNHPFASWKQQDYWGMAAFFAQIQTPGKSKAVYKVGLLDNPQMTMATLQETDMIEHFQRRPPTFLGGQELPADADSTHRAALAHWITSPQNPYFARAAVNRMWWQFFGRGIVNPVDDMHSGNAPSHPELLDLLSQRFAESGFDLKFLCRAILNSRTYQQTSRPGEEAELQAKLFARMSIKVLSAEQLYDSLVAILGQPVRASGVDTRLGARYEFSQFFGGEADTDPTRYERGIPHMLRMMNSPQFADGSVAALASRVAPAGRPADESIEQLFLTILSRRPTPAEQQLAREQLQTNGTRQSGYDDLAWALLMGSEFALNH
jgi:hypothetical protein